ncbi:MAG: hypothetical protein ABI642_04180 [Polaromonas sp.]
MVDVAGYRFAAKSMNCTTGLQKVLLSAARWRCRVVLAALDASKFSLLIPAGSKKKEADGALSFD